MPAEPNQRLRTGPDGVRRCWWCGDDPLYVDYHDLEWGRPADDDVRLFEKLCLEGFQSGLAWITVLRKRPAFRTAFADFDPAQVARFTAGDVERLVADAGIIRHRGKIESTINNAQRALEMIDEHGSIHAYVSRYRTERRRRLSVDDELPATSAESVALSKDLKRKGWTFVGPTTVYSFMQAMGLVDDHLDGCFVEVTALPSTR
jgi:DNA-3-methyladenine glycosylase I